MPPISVRETLISISQSREICFFSSSYSGLSTSRTLPQFVDQAVTLQQVERAINRDARNVRVDFLSSVQDFVGVHVARGRLHHLQDDAALAGEADAARAELALEMACRLVFVDAFAGGYAMCRGGRHIVRPL